MLKKYFIAIVPPEEIYNRIEAVKLELLNEHKLKAALRSPAHITLHRPFEWKEEREAELINQLEDFGFKKKFAIDLKDFDCFRPRVIFVNVVKTEQLTDLHYLLGGYAKRQLGVFNESEDMRGFHPHITVAFRDLKKQKFYKLWEEKFQNRKFEGAFIFSGFCLLRLDTKWEIIHKFDI